MVPPPFGDDVIRVFGIGIRSQEILILVVSLLIMAVFDFIMQRTMVGKAMRAVAHNRQVASLMGINVTAVMLGAFFISSALAGLSGILIAPIASASLYLGLASRSRASPARSSGASPTHAAACWAGSLWGSSNQ